MLIITDLDSFKKRDVEMDDFRNPRYFDGKGYPIKSSIIDGIPSISTAVNGKYRIKIQNSKTGSVRLPLGEGTHQNMITDWGLKYLSGVVEGAYDTIYGRSSFMQGVGCIGINGGDGAYKAVAWIGSNGTTPTKNDTVLGTPIKAHTSIPTGYTCKIDTSQLASTGVVSAYMSYQFSAEVATVTYREAGIFPPSHGNNTNLLSRFVFPVEIVVNVDEFIILEYILSAYDPISVTSIPMRSSQYNFLNSGGFDARGELRKVGLYDNLYGAMSSAGLVTRNNSQISLLPTELSAGTFFCKSSLIRTSAGTAAITLPSTNASLSAIVAANSTTISQTSATTFSDSTNRIFGVNTNFQFLIGNPSVTVDIGGILFGDSYTFSLLSGFCWKFDTVQSASLQKTLRFGITQRIGVMTT